MKRHGILILIASMTASSAFASPPAATEGSSATAAAGTPAAPSAAADTVAVAGKQPRAAAAAPQPAQGAQQPAAGTGTATVAATGSPAAAVAPNPATSGTLHGVITSTPAAAAKSAVVYLQDGPLSQPVSGAVSNKQMTFSPFITVVTAGSKVTFTNADPFPHNVFSPDHEKWDLGQLDQHGSKPRTFAKAGAYTLLCNMHPNMKAYILVVPSNYFAKSDSKGNFTIKDVPAGTYKVAAWAPGVQTSTQTVTVSGDTTTNFELHR